jgi:hypothetical protein
MLGWFYGGTKSTNVRVSLPAVCFVWQIAMIVLFGVFIRYNEEADTHWQEFRRENNISSDIENDFYFRYPSKCDLHLGLQTDPLSLEHILIYCIYIHPYILYLYSYLCNHFNACDWCLFIAFSFEMVNFIIYHPIKEIT